MGDRVRTWTEGTRGFLEARYRANERGLREAQADAARLSADGMTVLNVQQTGGHLSATRSIGTSLVGLGLLRATGFGFFGAVRSPGEIIVTFEKTGPSQRELAEQAELAATAHRSSVTAIAQHEEFQKGPLGGPHGKAAVVNSRPTSNGAALAVQVTNTDPYDWTEYELEAVVYRPLDGSTIRTFTKTIKHHLAAGRSGVVGVNLSDIPAGDVGVLVGVIRVRPK